MWMTMLIFLVRPSLWYLSKFIISSMQDRLDFCNMKGESENMATKIFTLWLFNKTILKLIFIKKQGNVRNFTYEHSFSLVRHYKTCITMLRASGFKDSKWVYLYLPLHTYLYIWPLPLMVTLSIKNINYCKFNLVQMIFPQGVSLPPRYWKITSYHISILIISYRIFFNIALTDLKFLKYSTY